MSTRLVETVVAVFALVLGVVALIIASVSLNRGNGVNISWLDGSTDTGTSTGDRDNKVWQIAIGHAGTSYEYVHEPTGEVRGFNVDLISAVCRIANKNCQLVFDSYQRCWDSQKGTRPQGGEGLFRGYYDACTGWQQAYDRLRTFKFSDPFTEIFAAVFTVKAGNPSGFNWKDLTGRTIGLVDGFAYNENCIAREAATITGAELSEEQYHHYQSRESLLAAVNDGEVDAAFDAKSSFLTTELEVNSEDILSCSKAGSSFMMRKDSGFADWWNPAFAQLTATSEFRTICDGLKDEHGHKPGPDPVGFCIGLK